MNQRYQLLSDYLDELWEIKGLAPQTKKEKQNLFNAILGNNETQWIDIKEGAELVGFLIVATQPNCHPDADFYIEEAYVKPAHRRKHIMFNMVKDFINHHHGTYCLFILNKNAIAKQFWNTVFKQLGYQPHPLRDVGAGDEFCTQYGFKPKQI